MKKDKVLITVESTFGTRPPLWWDGHGWIPSKDGAMSMPRKDAEELVKRMWVEKYLAPTIGDWKNPTVVEG